MDQAVTRAASATPSTTPPATAAPRRWSLLLTSQNHGVVGAAGSEFKSVPAGYERVQVMEIVEAGAPPAPGADLAGLVRLLLTNEQIAAGAAIECDHGAPIGRNAAIDVFDAMCAAAPVAAQAGQVAQAGLSEDRLDRIARNYFSEQWAIQHAKDAIHDALTEAGATGQVAVPEGFVLMPRRLTAENGAKGLLSGEFHESIDIECPECLGDGDDSYGEDCPECSGMGKVQQRITVEWDTIKRIYGMAVEHLAAPSAPAVAQQAPADSIDTPGVRALLTELAAWGGDGGMVKANEFVGRAAAAIRAPAQASAAGERQKGGAA